MTFTFLMFALIQHSLARPDILSTFAMKNRSLQSLPLIISIVEMNGEDEEDIEYDDFGSFNPIHKDNK